MQRLRIYTEVSSFEKAKEPLDILGVLIDKYEEPLDILGVLIDKYEIATTISIFPQADFEELYRLSQ